MSLVNKPCAFCGNFTNRFGETELYQIPGIWVTQFSHVRCRGDDCDRHVARGAFCNNEQFAAIITSSPFRSNDIEMLQLFCEEHLLDAVLSYMGSIYNWELRRWPDGFPVSQSGGSME